MAGEREPFERHGKVKTSRLTVFKKRPGESGRKKDKLFTFKKTHDKKIRLFKSYFDRRLQSNNGVVMRLRLIIIAIISEETGVILSDIKEILQAEVVVGADQLNKEVTAAFAADLMSDVLAFAKPGSLLLTGLTNPQVVRTSDILDIAAIIIVRGKIPPSQTIQLAEELKIPILSTKFILFEASGKLYERGIVGCIDQTIGVAPILA